MSTRIRLRRLGATKRPFYRVVVADQRSPRNGRFIENIGKYHPLDDPSLIEIDEERALHWLRVGAQPSEQVQNLFTKVGIWEKFVGERPGAASRTKRQREATPTHKVSKKAAAKAASEEVAPEPAVPEEVAPEPAVPEEAAPEPAVPEEAAPAQAVSEEAAQEPAAPETDASDTSSVEETSEP